METTLSRGRHRGNPPERDLLTMLVWDLGLGFWFGIVVWDLGLGSWFGILGLGSLAWDLCLGEPGWDGRGNRLADTGGTLRSATPATAL